jgi:muramoyltetrapeptide carboxypeptidase
MKPSALKPGDTIGVMAPSSYVEKDDIEKSKTALEKKGYKVFVHPQTYERENQSAGTHLQKTLALQGLWQREDIKAIWAAGGGNRALHLIKSINFDAMKKKPKILVGFSDATVLLNAVYAHTDLPTFHGQVFKNVHKYGQLDELLDLLAGKAISMPQENAKIIQDGKAEGVLVGGNLSMFTCLPTVLPGEFWKDGILFLEDVNEEASRIDRAILHLKNLGVLKSVKGIVFGQLEKTQETGRPFGYNLEDIIREHTQDLGIPVVMNAPFGHGGVLHPLPIGIKAKLKAEKGKISLETAESAVAA